MDVYRLFENISKEPYNFRELENVRFFHAKWADAHDEIGADLYFDNPLFYLKRDDAIADAGGKGRFLFVYEADIIAPSALILDDKGRTLYDKDIRYEIEEESGDKMDKIGANGIISPDGARFRFLPGTDHVAFIVKKIKVYKSHTDAEPIAAGPNIDIALRQLGRKFRS
jgi:hypothetical protein